MTLAVQFTNVSRQFGEVKAVDRVSIDIQDGEFFSMLGPSGSGKTTCLRLIAGFEQPSAGSIRIHGEEAAGLPPYQRDVNTVFQDYDRNPGTRCSRHAGTAAARRPLRREYGSSLRSVVQNRRSGADKWFCPSRKGRAWKRTRRPEYRWKPGQRPSLRRTDGKRW